MKNPLFFWIVLQLFILSWVVSDLSRPRLCHNSKAVKKLVISRNSSWIPACWSPYKLHASALTEVGRQWKGALDNLDISVLVQGLFNASRPIDLFIDEWREGIVEVTSSSVYFSKEKYFDRYHLSRAVLESHYLQAQNTKESNFWSRSLSHFFLLSNGYSELSVRQSRKELAVAKLLVGIQKQLPWGDRLSFIKTLSKVHSGYMSAKLKAASKQELAQLVPELVSSYAQLDFKNKEERAFKKRQAKEKQYRYELKASVRQVCGWPSVQAIRSNLKANHVFFVNRCGKKIVKEGDLRISVVKNFLKRHSHLQYIAFHRPSLKMFEEKKGLVEIPSPSPLQWTRLLSATESRYSSDLSSYRPLSIIPVVTAYRTGP